MSDKDGDCRRYTIKSKKQFEGQGHDWSLLLPPLTSSSSPPTNYFRLPPQSPTCRTKTSDNPLPLRTSSLLNLVSCWRPQLNSQHKNDVAPRVSPAASINFTEGVKFFTREETWDTRGFGGPAALRPLTAASNIVLLGHSDHCPTNTHWRQTNEWTIHIISISKQKDSAVA